MNGDKYYRHTPPQGSTHRQFIEGAWRNDRYQFFEDQDFVRWLRERDVRTPIFEYQNGIFRMLLKEPLFPKQPLPPGFWYKGGCARTLFLKRLGIPCPDPRDIDLVQHRSIALRMANRYPLPADIDPVETIGWMLSDDEEPLEDTFEAYFHSRDFTINEVLANDHEVYFTKAALQDALAHTIEITPFQEEENNRDNSSAVKSFSRALRFSLELSEADPEHPWEIDAWAWQNIDQRMLDQYAFNIFLHVDRLLEKGLAWAEWYLEAWHERGFFIDQQDISMFVTHLAKNIRPGYRSHSEYLAERPYLFG